MRQKKKDQKSKHSSLFTKTWREKYFDEKQQQKEIGWQNCTWYWLYSDLQKSHRERERRADKGGADGGEEEEEKEEKKTKTRGPSKCWKTVHDHWQTRVELLFSPFFLSNSGSPVLSSSPLSVSNH